MSKYSKVVIDVIGEKFDKVWARINKGLEVESNLADGVTQLYAKRKQAQDAGYLTVQAEVARQFANNNYPTQDINKMMNSIIKYAPAKLFITINLKDVRSQVFSAILANENLPESQKSKVVVFRPFKKFTSISGPKHALAVQDAEQWAVMLEEEHKSNIDYAINQERLLNTQYLINSDQKWLGDKTLPILLGKMGGDIGALLQYCECVIDDISREGIWDADMNATESFVDALSAYTSVDTTSGSNKGKRVEKVYGQGKTFKNLVTTDADILQHFLTLTFYKAVGMKPMAKMIMIPGVADHGYGPEGTMKLVPLNPEEEFESSYFKATGFATTPIYVTPEQSHKKYCVEGYVNPKAVYELPEVR